MGNGAHVFRPLSDTSARARIADAIRDAIFSGQLSAGEPLIELRLAEQFQVSQTTIREALLHLERSTLVRRVPNKGTFVTKLTPAEVEERYAVRETLEEMAAIEAAARMKPQHFEEIGKLLKQLSGHIFANRYFESAQTDLHFHRYIWNRSENRLLTEILEQVTAPLIVFISVLRSQEHQNLKRVVHSHEAIVDALRSGKKQTIRQAIRFHFDNPYKTSALSNSGASQY